MKSLDTTDAEARRQRNEAIRTGQAAPELNIPAPRVRFNPVEALPRDPKTGRLLPLGPRQSADKKRTLRPRTPEEKQKRRDAAAAKRAFALAERDREKDDHRARQRRIEEFARQRAQARNPTTTDAVSNGRKFLPAIDQRSAFGRRAQNLFFETLSDLGSADACSTSERNLAKRLSIMTASAEIIEAKICQAMDLKKSPEKEDLDNYLKLTAMISQLARQLGLKRRPKEIVPTIDEYLKHGDNAL